MLIYTHCWELMNSVGSNGSLSLPFMMKVMVCHFVSHEVMTALIVVLPLIVVVEISLQLHRSFQAAADSCSSCKRRTVSNCTVLFRALMIL